MSGRTWHGCWRATPSRPRPARQAAWVLGRTDTGWPRRPAKAYDLAVSVLGRDAGFDAQVDPIVRVEVGRLRRDLDHYYLTDGRAEPFRIAIPKGRYIAVWEAGGARGRYTHLRA